MNIIRFNRLIKKYMLIVWWSLLNLGYIMRLVHWITFMIFGVHFPSHYGQKSSSPKRQKTKTQETTGLNFVKNCAKIYNVETESFIRYLTTTPQFSTVRVNVQNYKPVELMEIFRKQLIQRYEDTPEMYVHPDIPDCIVVGPLRKLCQVQEHPVEIIVDQSCGLAVLRGADIFAPGVLAMPLGAQMDSAVSVYVDIARKCLRGRTVPYTNDKTLIASGILKMNRHQLFANNLAPKGVAVEITQVVSGVPHIDVNPGMGLLQNLPSILASHSLEVHPGQKVLDMCAAPGNKLTHVAQLMTDTGTLIALDKSRQRVDRLKETIKQWNLTSVQAHVFDSTLICSSSIADVDRLSLQGGSFDRVLLDAPCSGFGQRPMFLEALGELNTSKRINSYTRIQKKLLEVALALLKVNGILVYCTCSLSIEENEALIAQFLQTHSEVELVPVIPRLGAIGLAYANLTEQDRQCMQRFGPNAFQNSPDSDTIGFFVCKMRKTTHNVR